MSPNFIFSCSLNLPLTFPPLEKTPLASSQSGLIVKYLAQSNFLWDHRSGNKNIYLLEDVSKFGIISKLNICRVWNNGQGFGNFEESLRQGMLYETKN